MFLIFMSSIISMILVMIRVRDYEGFKQTIKDYERIHKKKVKKTKIPGMFLIPYLIGLLGILIVVFFTYIHSMQMNEFGVNFIISLSVCLISFFLADIFWKRWKVRLYYDEEGFFVKQNYFRFSNVKEIIPSHKKDRFNLVFHNGKAVMISSFQAKQLDLLMGQGKH